MASRETAKAEWERQVFTEFLSLAGMQIVPGSLESRPPPEPDIVCEFLDRGRIAFELVNLADEDLMRAVSRSIRGHTEAVAYADPTLQLVTEKLTRKKYRTPYSMELLAYGDDTLLPYDVWKPKYARRLMGLVDRVSQASASDPARSVFQRVWVVNLGSLARRQPIWLVHPPM